MIDGGRISRRTVLRGVGTVVALPFLEAMMPRALAAAPAAAGPPRRMAFIYVPNGAIMSDWTPSDRRGRLRAAGDPPAAGPAQRRPAGAQRPDLRQGPGQRRRRRRPRPRLVGVPDRLPGEEDRRGQLPVRHLGRPGRRQPDRRSHPAPLAGARHRAVPRDAATATAAIHASTSTPCPGDRRLRRCRPRSIPGWSSIACSPSVPTTPTASSGIACGPACSTPSWTMPGA